LEFSPAKKLLFLANLPSKGSSFGSDTFLKTAVTEDDVGIIVENLKARLVESSGKLSLSKSKTNSVGNTLTERTSGDFNTFSMAAFRVTRGPNYQQNLDGFVRTFSGKIKTTHGTLRSTQ
jgi:hypothetical protein